MAQYDVDLRDYWRILKKRKYLVIFMAILAGISSYIFAKIKEPNPMYRATAAINIEQTSNLASALVGGAVKYNDLETHSYLITSFPVMELTAKYLGWIPEDAKSEQIRKNDEYISQIDRLRGMVTSKPEYGTNVILISVTSRNPDKTAIIANTVSRAYRQFNINERNRQTFETIDFIEKQVGQTRTKLQTAEEKLQSFKEGYALISMDAQTNNILGKLRKAEEEFEKINAKKLDIESILEMLDKFGKTQSKNLEGALLSRTKDSTVTNLMTKLNALFLKKQMLLVDYTQQHPAVLEITKEIKTIITNAKKELNSLLNDINLRNATLTENIDNLNKEKEALPEKALQLVRLEREVRLQEQFLSKYEIKLRETQIKESGKIEEVTLIKPAVIPMQPFNIPSKFMIVVTGIVLGLVIGLVIAFGSEVFDTSIGTIEDVEEILQVPVLGVIPFFGNEDKTYREQIKKNPEKASSSMGRSRDLVMHYDPMSLAAEAFRTLRSNLQFISLDKKIKSILITSSFVQEGKTFNSVNLALSMAQTGSKILLICADLRKPIVHKVFGIDRAPGLTDYVLGNYKWKDVINTITDVMLGDFEIDDILTTPGLDNLSIVTAGINPPNPAEILRSKRFKKFLDEAYANYDLVIIDAPPILPVADATEIAAFVDGVVLIYMVGKIGRGVVKRAKSSLDNVNANVLGVILNNVKPEIGPDYFRYQTKYYYSNDADAKGTRRSKLK